MKNLLKRPKTYILLFLSVIIIAAGVYAYDYYQIYAMAQSPSNEEIGDDVENPFDKIGDFEEGNLSAEEDANKEKNSEHNSENKSGNKTNIETSKSTSGKSYEEITGSYKSRFASLQAQQESKLNGLVGQAKTEYASGVSKVKIGAKYLNLANKMESQAESEFNQLKNQLKSELTSNSHNITIINEIESYYQHRKRVIKAEMLSKLN